MRYIQCFLTVNDGKWLIAEAISKMEPVRAALESGSIVFKGGTTVSCISQLMTGLELRVGGRNSPRGAMSSKNEVESPHTVLLKDGVTQNMDGRMDEVLSELGPGDVMIIGANLIDGQGNAALLAGFPGGGQYGRISSYMSCEGFKVIIAAGLEKMTPGSVRDAMLAVRRKNIDSSYGMSCGLFPVAGELVTELEAIKLLADVEVAIIGRGGIDGGEGGILLQIWGEEGQVAVVEGAIERCKGKEVAGDPLSLEECVVPSSGCARHLSCRYRKKGS